MKTLTTKLAVAALLVAGTVQAADEVNLWLSTTALVWNANDAFQTASTSWYAAQSAQQNATKLQKAKAFVSKAPNYVLPLAQVAAATVLAARVNNCVRFESLPKFDQNVAVIGLTALTVGKYLYNTRTNTQKTADAAVVAAAETSAAQAAANASAAAQTAAAQSTAAKARK